MDPFSTIAVRAARQAGQILLQTRDQILRSPQEPLALLRLIERTQSNIEHRLRSTILSAYPKHTVHLTTDETQIPLDEPDKPTWWINVLSGTLNFCYGSPQFAICLALRDRNTTRNAVIYDLLQNNLFVATKGRGAQLNGYRLRLATPPPLIHALLGIYGRKPDSISKVQDLIPSHHHRSSGSLALDFAQLAASQLHILSVADPSPSALLAGTLLLQEVGGLCHALDGSVDILQAKILLAGAPVLLKSILKN